MTPTLGTREWWLLQLARLALFGAIIGGWEYIAAHKIVDPLLIGQPSGISRYLWTELFVTRSLLLDLQYTLAGAAMAFVFGSAAGILIGMLFVSLPWLEALLSPLFTALNAMPRIALAPLFLIWFGLGLGSKVALGFSLTFFILLYATVAGGRSVHPDHELLGEALGATAAQKFQKFTLPGAIPVIFSGLRMALIFALLGVVGGEILAAEHGLGQTLSVLAASFRTNGVFGVILLLALIGVAISSAMSWLEERLLRWR